MSKLALDNVLSNRCNVLNVEILTMRQKSILFPFEWVPRLRHLILEYILVLNVSIDSHLEYVLFYIVDSFRFGNLLFLTSPFQPLNLATTRRVRS